MDFIENFFNMISANFGASLPQLVKALIVLVVGLILAGVVRRIVRGLFGRTRIDERLGRTMKLNFNLGDFIAKLAYYLAVVYVLLLVLDMMGFDSVLDPIRDMFGKFVDFIPNLIAGGLIGFAGYVIAKIASETVGFVSSSIEGFSARIGYKNPLGLTRILKQLVFLFVFIPIIIAALDAINIDSISRPATAMFNQLLEGIPAIISAALIIGVFYFVGMYIVAILKDLLRNLGIDELSERVGLNNIIGDNSISNILGNIAFFFLMFTGVISAVEKLDMVVVSEILGKTFHIAGQIFFGLVILLVGSFISNLASNAMSKSSSGAWMGTMVRFAVLGIFLAFALHTMGIAQSIVNLAFGLTLGSVAVAFALAFGLGGREAAGKQMDYFFEEFRKDGKKK